MFSRKDLKQRAKNVLNTNYWTALALVVLIYVAERALTLILFSEMISGVFFGIMYGYVFLAILCQIIASVSYIVIFPFLMPLDTGLFKSLIKSSNGEKSGIKDIIWGYKNNFSNTVYSYLKIYAILSLLLFITSIVAVWGMLLSASLASSLDITLPDGMGWVVLYASGILFALIGSIPAMIKSYDYYLAGLILADEPYLTSKEVLKRSKDLMKGHRFFAFKLDLSFIGWNILGGFIFFGLGTIFVSPYIYQTRTELYLELTGKKKDTVFDAEFKETSFPEKEENTEEENI